MISALLLTVLSAAPTQLEVERAVRDRFEAVGRTAPPVDPALSRAALALAKRAQAEGLRGASGVLRVTAAISHEGGWEPTPTVIGLETPNDELLSRLAKADLGDEPTTHLGLGLISGPERSVLVALLGGRRVTLAPFPRSAPAPQKARRLCGTLAEGLTSAELFVTRPDGAVERAPLQPDGAQHCAAVAFPSHGRHTVELLARGAHGPEVVALFFFDVGSVVAERDEPLPEPAEPRPALLARINALRLESGLSPLRPDAALEAVAQAYAERLAREGFFSHVSPDGLTPHARLLAAGYPSSADGENLGLSTGPLAAHFGLEHSPGHRENLLKPGYRQLGIGLAVRPDGACVLVELLAQPPEAQTPPLPALYASIAAERARLGLRPLVVSPALQRLAQAHAEEALARELPKGALPGRPSLHERAFAADEALAGVSVDVLVTGAPRLGPGGKNLSDPRQQVVGVGVVQGDSRQYGAGRFWVVVIYGVRRE